MNDAQVNTSGCPQVAGTETGFRRRLVLCDWAALQLLNFGCCAL
jgi:hypothetical protein